MEFICIIKVDYGSKTYENFNRVCIQYVYNYRMWRNLGDNVFSVVILQRKNSLRKLLRNNKEKYIKLTKQCQPIFFFANIAIGMKIFREQMQNRVFLEPFTNDTHETYFGETTKNRNKTSYRMWNNYSSWHQLHLETYTHLSDKIYSEKTIDRVKRRHVNVLPSNCSVSYDTYKLIAYISDVGTLKISVRKRWIIRHWICKFTRNLTCIYIVCACECVLALQCIQMKKSKIKFATELKQAKINSYKLFNFKSRNSR